MSRLKTINLKVPDGAEAGDSLTFSVDGKELEFRIPDNSKPGDVLQIQIQVEGDANDDDEHDGENGVTIVALHSSIGASLEIHDCIPGGSPADGECEDEEPSPLDNTKEAQGNVSDGTSSMVWPAGLHLAKFISSPQFDEKLNICDNVKHVVELGSGSGLCGLALAATASSKLSKRKHDAKKLKIILTDVPKAMNLLKYNIESNMDKLSSHLEEENLCARPLT